MSTDVTANTLFCGPDCGLLENVVLRHDNGIITSISESAPPRTARRTFVIPAFVNAHDHARPTASSFGAVNMPLESWIIRSAFGIDRKSTRLNSSHSQISYAVFCLKKKSKDQQIIKVKQTVSNMTDKAQPTINTITNTSTLTPQHNRHPHIITIQHIQIIFLGVANN